MPKTNTPVAKPKRQKTKAEIAAAGIDLRKLAFSPEENPLVEPQEIKTRKRHVKTGVKRELVDRDTGEVHAQSVIHKITEYDPETFVKVFAAGIRATFDLSQTGAKVFQAVLDAYYHESMTGGYADCVRLFWFGDGLDGRSIGMSQYTFNRGLKELIAMKFLSPRSPDLYWVNPAMFFKGDRVAFVDELRRKRSDPAIKVDDRQLPNETNISPLADPYITGLKLGVDNNDE